MQILAVDLSLNCTGWAVLECGFGKITLVDKGIINNKPIPSKDLGKKLEHIQTQLNIILQTYKVDCIVKEASFNTGRITSTQRTFQAFGVMLLTVYKLGYYSICELAATTVKKLITGSGKADKSEVKGKLVDFVGEQIYKTEDESDAVALGIAYLIKERYI